MIVTRRDLEESLARVRETVVDPRGGIHGPGSAAWKLQRDALIFLGGGRAALLQLAHPFVAYAIDQHSKTRDDVVGRFQRTFMNVFAMSFGDLDEAFGAARRVHNIHSRITGTIPIDVGAFPAGTTYHANDASSLLWVYATLVHTAVQVRERVLGRMSSALRERYYRDTWSFARLFAIPESMIPPTWAAFDRYVAETITTLAVAPPAREMSRFLLGGRLGGLLRVVTAGLLPHRLRVQYGLPWGASEQVRFRAVLGAVGAAWRVLPARARYLPAYVDARRRVDGLGPSALAKWTEARLYSLASLAAATPR